MLMFQPPDVLLAQGSKLAVPAGVIDLWGVRLTAAAPTLRACEGLLDATERARAERFVFERDRDRFLIAHGVLRSVLARYGHLPPQALRFGHRDAGKPHLIVDPGDEPGLHFNLSHSEDRALIGVTTLGEIGVDLEAVRTDPGILAIAHHYFFGAEHVDIDAAPLPERPARFFRYWVAKESVLKAQGIGLGFALDRFAVRFDGAARDAASITTLDPAQLADAWCVQLPSAPPGWLAAVAAAGRNWQVRQR